MKRVHPNHRPTIYSRDRHFIFAFHDTAFECVAHGIRNVARLAYVDRAKLLDEMRRRILSRT